MKKLLLIALQYVIAFGIAGLLVWLSLHDLTKQDGADIKAALYRADLWLILPVFGILMMSHWIRSLRWRQIIFPLGFNPPVIDLLCVLLVGYITNQLIPRAGEIIRCTILGRQEKIPIEKLIGTVVTERATDIVTLFLLSIAAVLFEYPYIKDYLFEIVTYLKAWLGGPDTRYHWIVVLLVLVVISWILYAIKKRNKKWGKLITRLLKGIWEGLVSIRKVKNKSLFILYTVMMWICYIGAVWVGCFAMKETTHLSLGTCLSILVFGSFGMIVAPGGLGAYPYAVQKTLIQYGIQKNIAIAFGWVLWLVQFFFNIIFGILAYIFLQTRNRKYEKRGVRTA